MKKYLAILGAAIFALAAWAPAAVTGFDAVAISCSGVAVTGACTTYNVAPADFVHLPSVQSFTWQTIIAGGTATTVSVTLEGSLDGTTWTTLDTSTSTSGETRSIGVTAVKLFRCNVGTYSTNGTTLTCQIMPTRTTGGDSHTIAKGAAALATSAIASATCTSAQTATATGILTTDVVTASFNGDPTGVTGYVPLTTGMLTIIAYPSVDTVNFKVCNNTSASITPGAITLNWKVAR